MTLADRAAIVNLERELNQAIVGHQTTVRAALLALLAREHLLILGPPGTAKSMLVDEVARRIGTGSAGATVFSYLLTRTTTPAELFGPVSVSGLKQDVYRRITTGSLPEAHFVFLDEVFKSSSAILNTLLRALNERTFSNPQPAPIPLMTAVGASNELPQEDDLRAFFDRFLLRHVTGYAGERDFRAILALTADAAPVTPVPLATVEAAQVAVAAVPVADGILDQLVNLRRDLSAEGVTMSDRRWRRSIAVLRAAAWLDDRAVSEDDFEVYRLIGWQQPDQAALIARVAGRLVNPANQRVVEIDDEAAATVAALTEKLASGALAKGQRVLAVGEAIGALNEASAELTTLRHDLLASGRSTQRADRAIEQVATLTREWSQKLITGAY